jgi:hypothetical protein
MPGVVQVLVRDVTEAENAARVFSRWEEVIEGSAGAQGQRPFTPAHLPCS